MTDALIFDCDGTLADTMPAHYRAWQEVLASTGISFAEATFYAWGGRPTGDIARQLVADAGSPLDPVALARAKEQAFLAKIGNVGEILPIEPVVAIAREARGRVPIAVASGGQRHIVQLTLRHLGILDWFGAVVTAEDTPRHKPEPDVFLEAARLLGVPPAACTVYEDTDIGLEAARRAGMRCIDVRALR